MSPKNFDVLDLDVLTESDLDSASGGLVAVDLLVSELRGLAAQAVGVVSDRLGKKNVPAVDDNGDRTDVMGNKG